MLLIKSRQLLSLIFVYISGALVFALYLQYFEGIEPCPLCMLQRVVFIIIALVTLIALIHNPMVRGLRKYGIVNTIFSLCGIGLAARHMWLESLPPGQAPACGPSIDIMLQYLPLYEVLQNAIMGDGECAKVTWTLFNLSMADWSMLSFVFIFMLSVSIMLKPIGRF